MKTNDTRNEYETLLMPEPEIGGRDHLYDLVKEGAIDSDTLVVMVCKWLTDDEAMSMLDANELSPRFTRPLFVDVEIPEEDN
mgnify:CR=1 FL=1